MIEPGWIGKGINGDKWDSCLEFSSGVPEPNPCPPDLSTRKPVLWVVEGEKVIALVRRRDVGFISSRKT